MSEAKPAQTQQPKRSNSPAVRQNAAHDDDDVQTGTSLVPRAAAAVNPFSQAAGVGGASSGNALAAQVEQRAIAEVQARYIMARRFPRDERRACDRIINAFGRIGLAEDAEYQYSRGGTDISGLSIRAAEAIAQNWQNLEFGFSEVGRYRGDDAVMVSVVRAYAVDLETGTGPAREFHIRHWRDTKQGGYALKDERDIYELMANQAQRRVRACLLSLIPGDVQELARTQAATTLKAKADTSPEGIAKLLEAFGPYGVTKAHVEAKIQRRIDTISPGQYVTMRRIYSSLKDGMSKAADWFEMGEPDQPEASAVDQALAARRVSRTTTPPAETKTPPDETKGPAAEAEHLPADRPPTLVQVVQRLYASPDLDVLEVAGDLIGLLESEADRAKATEQFGIRKAEIEAAKGIVK